MPSFLKRLFRHRQSEARTPTEDFLSEVLADLLNRAPQATAVQIVLDCFIPQAMAPEFRSLVGDRPLDVRTQVRLPSGKVLDILIEVEGRPLLVIENKIGAAFQQHARTDDEAEDGENVREAGHDHQLITYGSWLRDADRPEGWPGVLTVLTHATLAPPDFQESYAHRYGVMPHQYYWRSFHGELHKLVGGDDHSVTPAWMFVGREICRFLESNNMGSSDLTSVDIATINISMDVSRRWSASFVEIGSELLHRHSEHLIAKGQESSLEPEHSRMWGWTYFSGEGKIYLAYGIYFAPLVGESATAIPPLPNQEHAFVAVGSDVTALKPANFDVPAEWSRVAKDFLVMKPLPLSDRSSGERFPQFLLRLIENEFATIMAFREAYRACLPQAARGPL